MSWNDFKELIAKPHYFLPYTIWFIFIFLFFALIFFNPVLINSFFFIIFALLFFILFVFLDNLSSHIIYKDYYGEPRKAFWDFLVTKVIRKIFLWIPFSLLVIYFMNFITFLLYNYVELVEEGLDGTAFVYDNLSSLIYTELPFTIFIFLIFYYFINTYLFYLEAYFKKYEFKKSLTEVFLLSKEKNVFFYRSGLVLMLIDLSCLIWFYLIGSMIPNIYIGLGLVLIYFIFAFTLKKLFVYKRLGEINVFR